VVFDLDGTLMSSNATIYKCTLRTFELLNMPVEIPEDEFNNKIGHHFQDIFNDFNIAVPDIEGFIDKYKTLYFDFIDHTYIYPNVADTLKMLRAEGVTISLLTTKGQDMAESILKHFSLDHYFTVIMGRTPEIPVKPAPDALLKICSVTGFSTAETIMVGDSELDVLCGKNAGTRTCAVTFGYRTEEFLVTQQPDFIISDMNELVNIIANS
ncbi:MAG: HAD family hydrolase, partial [Syntrophothermus sp.]